MTQPRRFVRVSARIPAELFCRFEDERHRRTLAERKRLSANDLFTSALEAFLREARNADEDLY